MFLICQNAAARYRSHFVVRTVAGERLTNFDIRFFHPGIVLGGTRQYVKPAIVLGLGGTPRFLLIVIMAPLACNAEPRHMLLF